MKFQLKIIKDKMNYIETDFIVFNVLLNSDIDTIYKMYNESDAAKEICNDKYFWERKFENDKLILINYKTNIDSWINEYKKVYNATIDIDDIIKISIIEKERDKNIDILNPNDGTIIMKFPDDYPSGYHVWFLPQELISKDVEKLNELKSSGEIHPMYIKFIPCENDSYKLIYRFRHEKDIYEVPVDILTLKEIKDIMIKSIYDSLVAVDNMYSKYLFDDYKSHDRNLGYSDIIRFSRLSMRDTFEYLRKNHHK